MQQGTNYAALALSTGIVWVLACAQADASDYFTGKSIEMVIGFEPGGGFDVYARTLARYIGRHIPGGPMIIPKNVLGAGSVKAAGYMYSVAPKDGTSIGAVSPGAIMSPLTDKDIARQYDASRFEYIGSTAAATRFCATYRTSNVKTFADALMTTAKIGATGTGGSTRYTPPVLNTLVGTKFKVVSGYKGSTEILLAMERGEVEGICGYDWSSFKTLQPTWIAEKKINILVQMGIDEEPEMTALGVPRIWQYLRNDEDKKLFELMVGSDLFLRPYLLPPGTAPEAIALLRQALDGTVADQEFLADAGKSKLFISSKTGEAVQDLVRKLYSSPPDLVARFQAAIRS